MPVAFTVEDGSGKLNANAYCTVEEATDYHASRLHSDTWTDSYAKEQQAAIMWATRLLDERFDWIGQPANTGQALQWPRFGTWNRDGHPVSRAIIPQWLKNATAELARHLVASDIEAPPDTAGFSRIAVGDIALTVDKRDRAPVIPPSVLSMVKFYCRPAKSAARFLVKA